jgi:uncharacterized sulfatase
MTPHRPPNFVIFLTDTQGANVIGCYGRPELRTTHIDRLASQGTRFDRAYTTCPVCTPARAGLFTGVYAHNAGPWANSIPLYANTRTLAHYLGDAGYHCAYSGKWHLSGHDYFDTGVCPEGWDPRLWYDGKNYLGDLGDAGVKRWREAASSIDAPPDPGITSEFTWAHRVSDRGIGFLRQRHERPFCLVLSYDEPHHPFACPPEFIEPFRDYGYPVGPSRHDTLANKPHIQRIWRQRIDQLPRQYQPLRDGTFHLPWYFGCNHFVDHQIGRVVEQLDRLGLDDNTWVLFTSDHGDLMGEHGLLSKGACMYDGAARVPLIVRPPRARQVPRVMRTPVSHADLLPTLLALAGAPTPEILDGQPMTSLLAGQEEPQRAAVIAFHRFEIGHDGCGGWQPIRCIVRDRFKLAINLHSSDELYDLASDPAEMHNLIADPGHTSLRDRLHAELQSWMDRRRDPFRGFVWSDRPWSVAAAPQWDGPYRPRPHDGAWPRELSYATGKPL